MNLTDIKLEIKRMMVKELDLRGKREADIPDDVPLFGSGGALGLDSLDALQLATALEERFSIEVPDDKESKHVFYSVDSLAEFVQSSLKES